MEVEGRKDGRPWNQHRSFVCKTIDRAGRNYSSESLLETKSGITAKCTVVGPVYMPSGGSPSQAELKISIAQLYGEARTSGHRTDWEDNEEDEKLENVRIGLRDALSALVFLKKYPRCELHLAFEVFGMDGPLFPWLINLAVHALLVARVELVDTLAGAAVALTAKDEVIVDPTGEEWNSAKATAVLAHLRAHDRFAFVKLTGKCTREQTEKLLAVGLATAKESNEFLQTSFEG